MTKEKLRILLVDDEQDYCDVLKMILEGKGYYVDACNNGQEALSFLEKAAFDIVVTDLSMPVMDGYQLLLEIRAREYDAQVLMLTAYGTIEKAVESMKAGAYTYVTKGADPEVLLMEIQRAAEIRSATRENRLLKEKNVQLKERLGGGYMLETNSGKFRQVLTLAERAAASEANILILGESGVGKEVLASFIHDKSERRSHDFMEFNCQALSESILESELFGHEKGAFTGAARRRIGHFEAADGGTLFLDEIGGVSINLQAKLLKTIEDKIIYRMGSSTPVKVDFRLIAATNRNLKEDIDKGLFRSDLFYRLSTIVLEIPPLRERWDDIPLFLDFFLDKYGRAMKKENIRMNDRVRRLLLDYDYPGNIRELRNIIERLLVLSADGEIREEHLPSEMLATGKEESRGNAFETDYTETLKEYRSKAEKSYIEGLLELYPDDLNKVADILSITRRQLFNKLVEFGLK